METSDIWKNIIIPIIIGPLFISIKILYDKWDYKKKETNILKNKIKLEKLNNKLAKFYWPLYILLLKDYDMWTKIVFKDINNIGITESDSDSDIDDTIDKYNYCIYMRKMGNTLIQCKNPVAINCIDKLGPYCLKHQHHKDKKILESITN